MLRKTLKVIREQRKILFKENYETFGRHLTSKNGCQETMKKLLRKT